VALVLGGCGLGLLFAAFIGLKTSRGLDAAIGAPATFGLAAILLVSAGFSYRASRRRGVRAERDIEGVLIADGQEGVLKDRSGRALSRLANVRVVVRRDLARTFGLAYGVTLSWPGGRQVVFRALGRRAVEEVVKTLADAGVCGVRPARLGRP